MSLNCTLTFLPSKEKKKLIGDNDPKLLGSKKGILILNSFILLPMGGATKILFLESAPILVPGLRETKTWVRSFQINRGFFLGQLDPLDLCWTSNIYMFNFKEKVDLSNIDLPFSLEELKQAVFNLGADKAPRPDSFPIIFIQKHWDLVKDSLIFLCNDFFEGRANLECVNWIHIALIAKASLTEKVYDFGPINLINSSCKIISKVLANRLGKVISYLVDDSQSAFIKGIFIVDNIIAAQELIFHLQKQKVLGYALKVDFAKAFDSLDWNFLFNILAA